MKHPAQRERARTVSKLHVMRLLLTASPYNSTHIKAGVCIHFRLCGISDLFLFGIYSYAKPRSSCCGLRAKSSGDSPLRPWVTLLLMLLQHIAFYSYCYGWIRSNNCFSTGRSQFVVTWRRLRSEWRSFSHSLFQRKSFYWWNSI